MSPPFIHNTMTLHFFLLLLAGHVLSDFLFQTANIAREKERGIKALLMHGIVTYAVHAAVLFPFWNMPLLLWLAALALVHIAIDRFKMNMHGDRDETLAVFFLDQGFHLAAMIGLVWLVSHRPGAPAVNSPFTNLDVYVRTMVIASGFVFNGTGGTTVVRLLLNRFPNINRSLREDRNPAYSMGRIIGVLERLILYLFVLLGHWEALGFVIAAKSIARFRELDEKGFADYYLTGTLASVLVALTSGISVRLLMDLL